MAEFTYESATSVVDQGYGYPMMCEAMGIPTSWDCNCRQRRDVIDVERLELRARVLGKL